MKKPAWALQAAARNQQKPQTVAKTTATTRVRVSKADTPHATAQPAAASVAATVTDTVSAGSGQKVLRAPRAGARGKTPDSSWYAAYLEELANNAGRIVAAAKYAGTTITTVCHHRLINPDFARAERDSLKHANTVLEDELIRRAVVGTESTWISYNKDGTKHEHRELKFSDTIALRYAVKLESGSWNEKRVIEHGGTMTFKTRADRKAALEKVRADMGKQAPVEAVNGRS